MSARTCLAIDIGGTKLAAGLVDGTGRILAHDQVPTPSTDDAEELFAVLGDLIGKVTDAGGQRPEVVGVGCGGPMSLALGEVSPLNIPAWRSFALRVRLETLLGIPVRLENDAKALALGEGWLGAAQALENFAAMVVSTGIGGGIVLDGQLLHGRMGNAGHLGHLIVVPGGRRCACGARGCLEAEASGTAIQARTGRPAADAGHEERRRCGELVGRAVASVVTLLDLEVVVVAGSVALGFGEEFFEAANASLEEHVGLTYTKDARIIPAGLGADGPLIGAAAVGFSERGAQAR